MKNKLIALVIVLAAVIIPILIYIFITSIGNRRHPLPYTSHINDTIMINKNEVALNTSF